MKNALAQFESSNQLPDLVGSEKQVAWARDIRHRFLNEVAEISIKSARETARITLAKRWIEEIRPFLGHPQKWIDARKVKLSPAECRSVIWQKSEAYKDANREFDLVGFMRYVAGKSDQWVLSNHMKPVSEMSRGMNALSKWLKSSGGNTESSILIQK